jgi:low temperature requirement protein LtrA
MVLLAAIGAMLILSLAAPRAFGSDALTFAIAYTAVRGLHVVLSAYVGRDEVALRRESIRLIPHTAVCGALLAAAALLGSRGQLAGWIAVAVISYAGPLLGHGEGWQISPPHFVERFGQIILIASGSPSSPSESAPRVSPSTPD